MERIDFEKKKRKGNRFRINVTMETFFEKKDYFGVCILGGWGKEVAKAECGCLDTNGQREKKGGVKKD